jgi:heme-degrading monooxygenase HmoA
VWRGITPAAKAEEYLEYLQRTGVSQCRATPGNRGVRVLRRVTAKGAEFVFVSRWESREAIQAFAGPDPDRAVYYPEDADFLLFMEPHVEHYDLLVEEGL